MNHLIVDKTLVQNDNLITACVYQAIFPQKGPLFTNLTNALFVAYRLLNWPPHEP